MMTLFYVGPENQIDAARWCFGKRCSPRLAVNETQKTRLSIEGGSAEVKFLLNRLAQVGWDHSAWSKTFRGEALSPEEYQALCS